MEGLTFEMGRVVAALPYHNQYVVRFFGSKGTQNCVSMDSSGDTRGGTSAGPSYLPGTTVLAAVIEDDSIAFKSYALPNVILGALAPFPTHAGSTNFVPRDIVLDSLSGYNDNGVYKRILENESVQIINQDRSFNRATDAVPGDWYKSTVMGGALLISDFLTRVSASERCGISMESLTDKMMVEFDALDVDAEMFKIAVKNYGDTLLRVTSDALSRGEGLGAVAGNPPFKNEKLSDDDLEDRVLPVSETQRGFFRCEDISGGAVEGVLRGIKTDMGSGVSPVYQDGEAVYPGVLREDMRMDGRYKLQALKEILLQKTAYIAVPYEKSDEVAEAEEVPEDDTFDREVLEDSLGSVDAYTDLRHLVNDLIDQGEAEKQLKGLSSRPANWKIPTQEELEGAIGSAPAELPSLDDDASAYSLADLSTALAVVAEIYPGRKIKIFKNQSSFLMADDGDVVIGDGFGAEIRMSKGNITIASAGDILMQPGRDMVEWVPRNKITKARGRIELASSNDSVSIKAEKNLAMLSGNGGTGSTVIENRAQNSNLSGIPVEALQQGASIGSGVHVRSHNAGVSILGDYLYAGGRARGSESTAGAAPSQCNILLEAGTGAAALKGFSAAVIGTGSASVAIEGTISGVYVAPSQIAVIAPNAITQTAPFVAVQGGGGETISKQYVSDDGVQARDVRIPSTSPVFAASGQIVAGGGVSVRGSIQVTEGIVANGLIGQPVGTPVKVTVPTTDVRNAPAAAATAVGNLLSYMTAAVGVQTERGQAILDFSYPASDSVGYRAKNFTVIQTKWQDKLSSNNSWVEREVTHSILENSTLPYPGREAYEDEAGRIRGVVVEDGTAREVRTSLNSYKINTNS